MVRLDNYAACGSRFVRVDELYGALDCRGRCLVSARAISGALYPKQGNIRRTSARKKRKGTLALGAGLPDI